MKKAVSLVIVTVLLVSFSSVSYAQNPPVKLGRGILNVLTGFWEVPLNMIRICKSDGMPKGLTIGLAKGVGMSLYRTVVGVYEILSFAIPAPADYAAITDPPTLMTSETLNPEDPSMRGDFSPLRDDIQGKSSGRGSSVK